MRVKTKVTFKEYVKLLYSLTYEKPLMQFLVGIALLLLLWIIFYYFKFINLPKPIIYQYLTLILIAVVQPIVIFITVYRNYKSSNHLCETLEMEMTQTEMKIEGESFYLEIKWNKLFKIVETQNYFLIYQNNLSAIIVPKKDLAQSEVAEFNGILKNIEDVPIELLD